MRNDRSGVGVIAYKEEIYALGGFNGMTRMNTGEKYCPKSNSWKTIPEMFNPRSNFAIEVKRSQDISNDLSRYER
jgi:kelch-like protein 10